MKLPVDLKANARAVVIINIIIVVVAVVVIIIVVVVIISRFGVGIRGKFYLWENNI